MKTIETDQRRLWKFIYSRSAFHHVEQICLQIENTPIPSDSPLYYPLCVATVVLYSRPFGNNFGVGRLPDEIVPSEYRGLHDGILEFRSRVAAHSDANGPFLGGYPANEVRFVRTDDDFRPYSPEAKGTPDTFPHIRTLAALLKEKCSYHLGKIMSQHYKETPSKRGEYTLDISETPTCFYREAETRFPDGVPFVRTI